MFNFIAWPLIFLNEYLNSLFETLSLIHTRYIFMKLFIYLYIAYTIDYNIFVFVEFIFFLRIFYIFSLIFSNFSIWLLYNFYILCCLWFCGNSVEIIILNFNSGYISEWLNGNVLNNLIFSKSKGKELRKN